MNIFYLSLYLSVYILQFKICQLVWEVDFFCFQTVGIESFKIKIMMLLTISNFRVIGSQFLSRVEQGSDRTSDQSLAVVFSILLPHGNCSVRISTEIRYAHPL